MRFKYLNLSLGSEVGSRRPCPKGGHGRKTLNLSGRPVHGTGPRRGQHKGAKDDPVPGKGHEIMRADKTDQPPDAPQGAEKRDHGARGKDRQIFGRQQGTVLPDGICASANQRGYS